MKAKRLSILLWLAVSCSAWFLSGLSWFTVTADARSFDVQGSQAFSVITGYLWLQAVSILAVFVMNRVTGLAIAFANSAVTVLLLMNLIAATADIPQSVIDFVAKQTGVSADYPYQILWPMSLFLVLLGLQSLISVLVGIATIKAPQVIKRYDTQTKRNSDDPIELWDSQ